MMFVLVNAEMFTFVYKLSRHTNVHRLITNCNKEPKEFWYMGTKWCRVDPVDMYIEPKGITIARCPTHINPMPRGLDIVTPYRTHNHQKELDVHILTAKSLQLPRHIGKTVNFGALYGNRNFKRMFK